MKKIITYGTFDLLHTGHINLLRRARELGDYLIVAVSSDTNKKKKHKDSVYSLEERMEILKAIKYVDEVIVEESWEQKEKDILNHGVSMFVIGDDWVNYFDELRVHCDVVYLPRTPNISTTDIRKKITNQQ